MGLEVNDAHPRLTAMANDPLSALQTEAQSEDQPGTPAIAVRNPAFT